MKHSIGWIAFGVVMALTVLVACGGETDPVDAAADSMKQAGEELADAVEDVSADAEAAVEGPLDQIKAAIAEKEDELKAIKDKLATLSPEDLAGSEASSLKEKSEGLMEEIKGLKEKLEAAMNG